MKKYIKTTTSRLLYVFLALNVAAAAPLYGMLVNNAARLRVIARNVKNRQMPRSQQTARFQHTTPKMAQYQRFMPEVKVAAAVAHVKQAIPVNNNTNSSKASYSSSHPWLAYLLGLFGLGLGMSTVSAEVEGVEVEENNNDKATEEQELLGLFKRWDSNFDARLIKYFENNDPHAENVRHFFGELFQCNSYKIILTLKEILYSHPHLARNLTFLVKGDPHYFLDGGYDSHEFLFLLLERNKEGAKEFVSGAKWHYKILLNSEWGTKLLILLGEQDPDISKIVIDFSREEGEGSKLLSSFKSMYRYNEDKNFEAGLIKYFENHDPNAENVRYLFKEFLQYDSYKTMSILKEILRSNPHLAPSLTFLAKDNPYKFSSNKISFGHEFLFLLLEKNGKVAEELIPMAKEHYKELLKTEWGRKFFILLGKQDSEISKILIKSSREGNDLRTSLSHIYSTGCDKEIEKIIKEELNQNKDPLATSLKIVAYTEQCEEHSLANEKNKLEKSPSYKHIGENLEKMRTEYVFDIIQNDRNVRNTLHAVIEKSESLRKEGYQVFFHAQRSIYGPVEDWFTWLYSLKHNKKCDDFIFTHVEKPIVDTKELLEEDLIRQRLMKEGNTKDSKTDSEGIANKARLLFTNFFIAGNNDRNGSNSLLFLAENKNIGDAEVSISDAFKLHGYEKYYHKHQAELEKMNKMILCNNNWNDYINYDNADYLFQGMVSNPWWNKKYGQLLVIAVKEEDLNKCVYLTGDGGEKKSMHIPGIGETSDTNAIVKYLEKHPVDATEFALVETWKNGGLDPDMVKVIPYRILASQDDMELKRETEKLRKAIEADIIEDQAKSWWGNLWSFVG